MTIEYSIEEKDYLTFQLFTASRSENIRKRRFRARTFPPIMYLVFGIVMFFYKRMDLVIIFGMLTVVWYLFYPLREKRLYRTSYQNFIRENFKNKFGQKATLTFNDQNMVSKDNVSEGKIAYSQVEEINEIPEMILIKLKEGQSFILPKDKLSDVDALKIKLKDIADRIGVAYRNDYEWKWK